MIKEKKRFFGFEEIICKLLAVLLLLTGVGMFLLHHYHKTRQYHMVFLAVFAEEPTNDNDPGKRFEQTQYVKQQLKNLNYVALRDGEVLKELYANPTKDPKRIADQETKYTRSYARWVMAKIAANYFGYFEDPGLPALEPRPTTQEFPCLPNQAPPIPQAMPCFIMQLKNS